MQRSCRRFQAEKGSGNAPGAAVSGAALLVAAAMTQGHVACATSEDEYALPQTHLQFDGGKDSTSDVSTDGGEDGTSSGDGGCKARTCAELGAGCGMAPDACGSAVYCGECPTGQLCGGGGPNVCGTAACSPKTCAQLGLSCGIASDGCNAALDCGTCGDNQTCGGGGVPNQCGCTPVTCASLGAQCGLAPDGCGAIQDCGGCPTDQLCGGAGANLCGDKPCTPLTCAAVGAECGQAQDGCGDTLSCPACASGTCSSNKCVCSPTWQANLAGQVSAAVLAPSGELYAAGLKEPDAWVARLDACDGTVKVSRTLQVAGATSSSASSLALWGNQVLVAGTTVSATDPGQGLYASLVAGTLTQSWAHALYGSTGHDELWGIAAPSNGSVWMAGTSDTLGTPRFWGVKATPTGTACGFAVGAEAGLGRGLVAVGDDIYMFGARGAAAVVTRFSASSCTTTGPCPCSPVWQSSPLTLATASTEPRAAVVVGSSIYLAGLTLETPGSLDYEAFVARVDLSSGQLLGAYRWNPTAQVDGFLAIGADAQRLYAAGGKNYDGTATWTSTTGVLVALPFALSSSTVPVWSKTLSSVHVAVGLTVDTPGNSLIVSGTGLTDGFVARCTTAGVCP